MNESVCHGEERRLRLPSLEGRLPSIVQDAASLSVGCYAKQVKPMLTSALQASFYIE